MSAVVNQNQTRRVAHIGVQLMCVLCLIAQGLHAQERAAPDAASRKRATALRAAEGIRLDGRLDEQAWQGAPAITDFVQKEPTEGAAPSERTDVRFVYDDQALYVGARMYSAQPSAIQAPLGRRDEATTQSEHLIVSLDTLFDHRTAYSFGVTASGVRIDRYYAIKLL
jgi:hypothetical protein